MLTINANDLLKISTNVDFAIHFIRYKKFRIRIENGVRLEMIENLLEKFKELNELNKNDLD